MSDVNNCFNCKDGKKLELMFSDDSDLARCKDPNRGNTSGLDIANYTKVSTKKRVYLVVKKDFTPTCWQERVDEDE